MRARLLFSVIPHYLSVVRPRDILCPTPSETFYFLPGDTPEMYVLPRDRKNERPRARDKTGRGAHAEFKRRGIFMRLSFIPGDEKFSPHIISNDRYFFCTRLSC